MDIFTLEGFLNEILGHVGGKYRNELFGFTLPDAINLSIPDIILVNIEGTPGYFNGKFRMWHHDHQFNVEAIALIPSHLVQSFLWLVSLARRRLQKKSKAIIT